MAVSENDTSDCNSDSSADGLSKERKERPFTKAIIRRLPPSMTKETFLTQVSPVPDYDYMYFVKADMSLGEYAFSRAYINFKNSSDIFIFKEKFDNYVFLDAKGNEYVAVVEFAPFSRIPKKRNKIRVDPKCGSIETDPVYADFLESLKNVTTENEEKPEYCFQPATEEEKQKNINTPLLEFIKQRRIDKQKMREEKREERKRREIERKRFKEEERRRRSRPENPTYSKSNKSIQILNSLRESDDKSKEDSKSSKERKYEDSKYERKPTLKDDRKYPYSKTTKEIRKSDDMYKKSPSKLRQRTYEKPDSKKLDPKRKEDTYRTNRRLNDYKETEEDRVIEKKVKKYSERREERKNEIKKLETFKTDEKPKESESKEELKETESKAESKSEVKHESKSSDQKSEDSDERNDSDQRKDDPRTQRRIRNKDRPTMAIYQPGMGLGRHKKPENSEKEKTDS